MRIQLLLKTQRKRLCHGFTGIVLIVLFLTFLTGCGGSSSSSNSTVASVTLTPASISLEAGQVVSITASAVNSANGTLTTTFTFNSSNTAVATVSPAGQVCAGVWDSIFVVCNGLDASQNPISGTATITATANGVTSGPVSVSVHPSVTAITIDPPPSGCFSIAQTHQFVAHAFHNGTEITNQVGNFTWSSSQTVAAVVDANGLATAHAPGITAVSAGVGGTTSPAVTLKSCMPVLIVLHINGDPAGVPTETATMNVTDTKTVQADMVDELGAVTPNAPVTILSNNNLVASVTGTLLTAESPGGAGLQAVCAPPTCGVGVNTPIYSNLFGVTVNGTSPNTTTVYATSSFLPSTGGNQMLPIDTSKTPPVAGTSIQLPGVPNSMVFDRTGAHAYLGTAGGLVALDPTTNTVSLVSPVPIGKVLAVSGDGTQVLVSNAANDPVAGTPINPFPSQQRLWLFNQTASTITTFVVPGATAATFDDDGFRAYIVASNGNVYVFSPLLTLQTLNIGGSSTSATTLASGPFVYVANSAGLVPIATCNNLQQPAVPTNSSTIQLVDSVRNANTIVAVDATGVDLETVNVLPSSAPLAITPTNCQPNVVYNNQFLDFGQGAFTANELLVASNGTHIAVLPAGLNRVFTVQPGQAVGVASLAAGGTEPLSGGMTPDGSTLWVGVAGSNTVDRINLLTNVDEVQIPTKFLKPDGSPAPPNIVVIKPK
ncbi:MAG TPA: Ig-like domain-containing protein [Candidatus Angelobacter sp.]|jgi:hypothetical protein